MLLWQFAQQERQQILEFESHLAAATSKVTITEANSLLISQLTTMDPKLVFAEKKTSLYCTTD